MIDEVSQVIKIISAIKSQAAACPLHAVSNDLTRLRFGGAGGFPWQVRVLRVPRLSLAVQTTGHPPARPELSQPVPRLSALARAEAAQPQGPTRTGRQADRPPSAV